jgi:hypothetical protein
LGQYESTAGEMINHSITADDIVNNHKRMSLKREGMRKANFRMPYVVDMTTEKSTYDQNINRPEGMK